MKTWTAYLALVAFLLTFPARAGKPGAPAVPNLVQVGPGLWRGGQPTDAGWAELRRLGITNVVKLNKESEGSDAKAESFGMRIYAAPITFPEQVGTKPIHTNELENLLVAVPVGGTFIHCEHGQDRTGLLVALWRVRRDGWSKADAEKEMLARGFHKSLRGLWRYWEGVKAGGMVPQPLPPAVH